MHYEVVIIGAGMSGLAAGVRLAHFGRRVLIVEKHTVWGGLNSFYKKGGHHFDVGLHAVTNWLRPGYRGPRVPLQRIYRQLRIKPEQFALEPQTQSSVRFDDARLRFTNDLEVLQSEVRALFPQQIDGFMRLCARCATYPEAKADTPFVSTRQVLAEYLSDPLLIDMLLCPLMFYGSAMQEDLDFEQFIILFNSIYREGFCRPQRGVKQILEVLIDKYEAAGGQMRRRCAVQSIVVKDGLVNELVLSTGDSVTADVVLSSAGLVETWNLRSDVEYNDMQQHAGQLAFTENLWVLDKDPKDLGFDDCVTFFNKGPKFRWSAPEEPVDLSSGVICVPGNYAHAEPLDRHLIRATHLANPRTWFEADEPQYRGTKQHYIEGSLQTVSDFAQDLTPHVVYTDGFTPRTVTHFTGHENGAVYGSPHKLKTGQTGVDNLFLCGTDQGFVGIVGAMLSGIAMANQYGLTTKGAA